MIIIVSYLFLSPFSSKGSHLVEGKSDVICDLSFRLIHDLL